MASSCFASVGFVWENSEEISSLGLELLGVAGLLLGNTGLALLERPLGGSPALGDDGLSGGGLLLVGGVGTDGLVDVLVEGLDILGLDAVLDVLRELLGVLLGVLLGKLLHVVGNVAAEDVLPEDLSVELLLLSGVAGETGVRVGNVEATIAGALERGKELSASRGAGKAGIEGGLEGLGALNLVEVVRPVLTGDLGLTLVLLGQVELGQMPAGEQEAGG